MTVKFHFTISARNMMRSSFALLELNQGMVGEVLFVGISCSGIKFLLK